MNGVTVEEYMQVLQEIEDNLPYLEIDKANEMLERVFSFKPVRLKWYLVKAKVMIKQGRAIRDILDFCLISVSLGIYMRVLRNTLNY